MPHLPHRLTCACMTSPSSSASETPPLVFDDYDVRPGASLAGAPTWAAVGPVRGAVRHDADWRYRWGAGGRRPGRSMLTLLPRLHSAVPRRTSGVCRGKNRRRSSPTSSSFLNSLKSELNGGSGASLSSVSSVSSVSSGRHHRGRPKSERRLSGRAGPPRLLRDRLIPASTLPPPFWNKVALRATQSSPERRQARIYLCGPGDLSNRAPSRKSKMSCRTDSRSLCAAIIIIIK